MVTGPVGSPYEGGVFYLYIQVPYSASRAAGRGATPCTTCTPSAARAASPRDVRERARALRAHRAPLDVALRHARHVLRQQLEQRHHEMYVNERARFERIARRWTWRYAIHDMYSVSS
ncbi:putative ubiquitin-conjugating enzyme morgue [Operophtera brumata]|uniref:Putative ubiquitin-conjugating enzyme morgue n=1 Tax=Operophtera brumata TaxID=104452 RepID=A0A0L7LHK4_OPEBR|nr:putative ubiquitin-conjugating enzyme morgue [Operophtera brumata]